MALWADKVRRLHRGGTQRLRAARSAQAAPPASAWGQALLMTQAAAYRQACRARPAAAAQHTPSATPSGLGRAPAPQYQPKVLDKFVLHKGIADNLKKLVRGGRS
jgi:hypothetical protein